MSHVNDISIHHTTRISAKAELGGDSTWLTIIFASDEGRFEVAAFIPYAVAHRVAAAINAAWDAPAERQRFTPPGIRGEDMLSDLSGLKHSSDDGPRPSQPTVDLDVFNTTRDRVIPLARLDAIQGDDGPDEAA